MKSTPTILVYRGEALSDQRVTRDEVLAALRSSGIADLEQAGAVILETDGSLSVIPAEVLRPAGGSALSGLIGQDTRGSTASQKSRS